MLTQISTIEEASAISAIGVDHVGVLVGDGRFPRELPISAACDIVAAIVARSLQLERVERLDAGVRTKNASLGVKSEKHYLIIFKHRAGEIAGCECASIYVYSIVTYLWLAYWCVAVNHNLSEATLVAEKIVSDPEKVVNALV